MLSSVLRKLEGFGPLTDDDKRLVRNLITYESPVAAKTTMVRENERSSHAYLMTAGYACRFKRLPGGKRQILAYLLAGDFCDFNAFNLRTIDYSIATLTSSRVVRIEKEAVLELLKSATLARAVSIAGLADQAMLYEWLANIGRRNAEQRIAHLFCELYFRLRAVGASSETSFALPISQSDLSDSVGLSLVHTNKSLKSLKDRGLVRFSGGTVVIPDIRLLESTCGFTSSYLELDAGEIEYKERESERPPSRLSERLALMRGGTAASDAWASPHS